MQLHRRAGSAVLRAAGPIAVAVAVQSAGNLAFHALVGRILAPAAYGALGTLLAAMVMLSIPLGALQTAASAHTARVGVGRATTARSLRAVALGTLPLGIATLVCTPLLRDYFHLDRLVDAALLAPYLVAAALLATARGLLLGAGRVRVVAHTYLAATGVRLALGLALAIPFGVLGALGATLLGEVAALALACRALAREPDEGPPARLRLGAIGGAAVAVTGLFLFSSIDLLLARHYLAGDASGEYVAAATVAKTVLALPAGVMAVLFPRLVAGHGHPGHGRLLAGALAAVAGPALAGAAVLAAVPQLLVGILYGPEYAGAVTLVQILAGVAGLTSVVTVLTNAALARQSWTTLIPWAGALLEVALIGHWHSSAGQIAAGSVAALLPTLVLIAVAEGRAWTNRTVRPHPPAAARPAVPPERARR